MKHGLTTKPVSLCSTKLYLNKTFKIMTHEVYDTLLIELKHLTNYKNLQFILAAREILFQT